MRDVCRNQKSREAAAEKLFDNSQHVTIHTDISARCKHPPSRQCDFLTVIAVPQQFVKELLIPFRFVIEEYCFNFYEWNDRNCLHRMERIHSDNGVQFIAYANDFCKWE